MSYIQYFTLDEWGNMDKGNNILYGDRVVVSGYEFLKNWLIQICKNYLKLL